MFALKTTSLAFSFVFPSLLVKPQLKQAKLRSEPREGLPVKMRDQIQDHEHGTEPYVDLVEDSLLLFLGNIV